MITKGKQIQFIPWNGVYVIARQYHGQNVMTIINGTKKNASLEVARYAEVIGNCEVAVDVITGRHVRLDKDVNLRPRQTLIIEF